MKNKQAVINSSLAVLACLLWSSAFPAIKITNRYADPFFTAGIRFILSGLMLIPFCGKLSRYTEMLKKQFKTVLFLSLMQTAVLYGLFFFGMTLIPGALGAIIIGSSPLSAAVISHFVFHNDRMTRKRSLSIIIGISGIVFISLSRKQFTSAGLNELLGVICLIGATVSSAVGNIIVSKDRQSLNPVVLNSLQIFLGGCLLLIFSLIVEGMPKLKYPPVYWSTLLWLSFISAFGFTLWFKLLKKPGVKVSQLNIWKFTIPAAGAVLSWMMLPEEKPEWTIAIGMILVSFSIIMYTRSSREAKHTSESEK